MKKTLYDLWDNMYRIALMNLGFILSLAIPLFLSGLIPIPIISLFIFIAGLLWCFTYLAAAAHTIKAIPDNKNFSLGDFFVNLRKNLAAGLFIGIAAVSIWAMAWFVIPFYLVMNSLPSLFLAAIIFWTIFLLLSSLQFFFAIHARLDRHLFKAVKKCFIVFFDNPGFSIASMLHNTIMLLISGFLVFLFPGPIGILLFLDEALRLRLLKYDWLKANDEFRDKPASPFKRIKIPWDAILTEEREKTGTRPFTSFIFPWKN